MIALRVSKVALVAAVALFDSLFTFGNLTDYDTNFVFRAARAVDGHDLPVFRHQVPGDYHPRPASRGIRADHRRASRGRGAVRDRRGGAGAAAARRDAASFNRSKTCAVLGLTLGFLLWQVGFMSIGGEWFGMWQSKEWNGVPSAFRFLITIVAVLIFVAMPDRELDRRS